MKILIFDTETTGLPKSRNASIYKTEDWPYVVQLSFILYDTSLVDKTNMNMHSNGPFIDMGDYLIKLPVGVEIEQGASAVHGITNEDSQKKGVSMLAAYRHFNKAAQQADMFVAHNIMFDKRLMMVESQRLGISHPFGMKGSWKPDYCTMKNSIELCKIEVKSQRTGETYYKYPKLMELHKHLFGYVPSGLHDSLVDILCCLRCYYKMQFDRDIIYEDRQFAALWRDKCIKDNDNLCL